MTNLLILLVLFTFGALGYRFRERLLAPLQRFEARNAARRAEEFQALFDGSAHYRETLRLASEQVEEVTKIPLPDERTGEPVSRYLFLGEIYATREEAEAARLAAVAEKAREFYVELDKTYLSRGRRGRGWLPGPPRG